MVNIIEDWECPRKLCGRKAQIFAVVKVVAFCVVCKYEYVSPDFDSDEHVCSAAFGRDADQRLVLLEFFTVSL